MKVIVVLMLASLLVATVFLIAFLWANRRGQFDDTHTPAVRILFEEEGEAKIVKAKKETGSRTD